MGSKKDGPFQEDIEGCSASLPETVEKHNQVKQDNHFKSRLEKSDLKKSMTEIGNL